MGRSIASYLPPLHRRELLAFAFCSSLSCASSAISIESDAIPQQDASEQRLAAELGTADLIFAGRVVDYYRSPPPVEPHGDYFAPVTYRVFRVFKGTVPTEDGNTVVVFQFARHPSPLVDAGLRLKPTVFGRDRTLVVFARREGGNLHSRDGVFAATRNVIEFLAGQDAELK